MVQPHPNTPFEYTGGNLCLDFADTVNGRIRNEPEELFTGYDRLLQWAEESGALSPKVSAQLQALAKREPARAESALARAVELREAIYDLFSAIAHDREPPQAALDVVNKAVQRAAQHARIVRGGGEFVSQWIEPENHLDAMLWPVARAAVDLLTSDSVAHIRQCAADDCAWLFVDKTKNHRRRWCEMKSCGNRAKARRYYHRQKAG